MTSSEVNGVTGIGIDYFLGAPDPDSCVSVATTVDPGVVGFGGCPVVHITGCPIIPTSTYSIVVIDDAGTVSDPLEADTQAKPGVKWHGDVVGRFDGDAGAWTEPNANVNIDDAVAGIKTFQQDPVTQAHVSVTDVHPVFVGGPHPNQLTNINDVATIILGFQGKEYAAPDIGGDCP